MDVTGAGASADPNTLWRRGENASLTPQNGFFSPVTRVRVTYNWDGLVGVTVEGLGTWTAGTGILRRSDPQTG